MRSLVLEVFLWMINLICVLGKSKFYPFLQVLPDNEPHNLALKKLGKDQPCFQVSTVFSYCLYML